MPSPRSPPSAPCREWAAPRGELSRPDSERTTWSVLACPEPVAPPESESRATGLTPGPRRDNGEVLGWLRRTLEAERLDVSRQLERQHQVLMARLDDYLRQRARDFREGPPDGEPSSTPRFATQPKLQSPPPSPRVPPKDTDLEPCAPKNGGTPEYRQTDAQKYRKSHSKLLDMEITANIMNDDQETKRFGSACWDCLMRGYEPVTWVVKNSAFEVAFGIAILLNTLLMCVELQYRGLRMGYRLGYHEHGFAEKHDPKNDNFEAVCYTIGLVFGFLFVFELVLMILGHGPGRWARSLWNWFDFIVVLFWCMDLLNMSNIGVNPMLLRLIRVARLLRVLRLIRWIRMLDTLHLLIGSITASVSTLFWAVCVILVVSTFLAMFFTQLNMGFIDDEANTDEDRTKMFTWFGTFLRSILTMFEITLGNWVPPCRFMFEKASAWYAVVFVIYKLSVGFGVLKVITAVFIQQTMRVAATDEEIMIMQKKSTAAKYAANLRRVFEELDVDGGGTLSLEEVRTGLANEHFSQWLAAMELEMTEAEDLFQLLDDGDGEVSFEEFMYAAKRLKGTSRSIDLITIMNEQRYVRRDIDRILQMFGGQPSSAGVAEKPLIPYKNCRTSLEASKSKPAS